MNSIRKRLNTPITTVQTIQISGNDTVPNIFCKNGIYTDNITIVKPNKTPKKSCLLPSSLILDTGLSKFLIEKAINKI